MEKEIRKTFENKAQFTEAMYGKTGGRTKIIFAKNSKTACVNLGLWSDPMP